MLSLSDERVRRPGNVRQAVGCTRIDGKETRREGGGGRHQTRRRRSHCPPKVTFCDGGSFVVDVDVDVDGGVVWAMPAMIRVVLLVISDGYFFGMMNTHLHTYLTVKYFAHKLELIDETFTQNPSTSLRHTLRTPTLPPD